MYLPKIKVSPMRHDHNVMTIARYLNPEFVGKNKSRPFAEKTYKLYPEIIGLIDDTMTYDEILHIVKPIVTKRLVESKEEIEGRIAYFQREFDKMNEELMIELLNVFEVPWEEGKDIDCYVGYIPFYPRSVVYKHFYVSYADEERVFRGMPHEINHMLFFEKWKQLYGYDKEQEPNHPEPLWFTMEMIVDPTLNTGRIQEITGYKHLSYEQFYTQTIDNKVVMDYINEFYSSSKSIKEFIDRTYEFCVSHIDELVIKCG